MRSELDNLIEVYEGKDSFFEVIVADDEEMKNNPNTKEIDIEEYLKILKQREG